MIHVKYTVECEKCGKEISERYAVDGFDFNELETASDFIDNFFFELVKVDGEIKLLCAECALKYNRTGGASEKGD